MFLPRSRTGGLVAPGARVAMIPTLERARAVERWLVDAADYYATRRESRR